MESRAYVRVVTFVLATVIVALTSFGTTVLAQKGPEQIPVSNIAMAVDKAGNKVQVSYELSTREELAKLRPSALREQGRAMRESLKANCASIEAGKGRRPVVGFVKDFAVEASLFSMAVGMSGAIQSDDPAYWRHWVERSVVDPMAQASFAGFMGASRGAMGIFKALNWTHDPCQILKEKPYANAARLTESKFQRKFRFIAGPLSMGAGLFISSAMSQVLSDKNIQMCAADMIGKTHGATPKNTKGASVSRDVESKLITAGDKACDTAYDEWVLGSGGKIRELAPDFLSMTLVSGLLGKVNELRAGVGAATESRAVLAASERLAGSVVKETSLRFAMSASMRVMVWRGLSVVMKFGQASPNPWAKAICFVGSTVVFLELQEMIEPFLKEPWDNFWSASDVGSSIGQLMSELDQLQKTGWVYRSKPRQAICDHPEWAQNPYSPAVLPMDCFQSAPTPAASVARMGKLEKKFRENLLGKTSKAVGDWQDYVLHFVGMYLNAKNFYETILNSIMSHDHPKVDAQHDPPYLYEEMPLLGIPVDNQKWGPEMGICKMPQENVSMLRDAVKRMDDWAAAMSVSTNPPVANYSDYFKVRDDGTLEIDPKISDDARYGFTSLGNMTPKLSQLALIRLIRYGFYSMDCAGPLVEIPAHASPAQVETIRYERFRKAVAALKWELEGRPQRSNWEGEVKSAASAYGLGAAINEFSPKAEDERAYVDTPDYLKYASVNIFAMVNYILGAPGVYPNGAGFLYSLNTYMDNKFDQPKKIGNIDTLVLSDYLLTSMVCGPDASQSIVSRSGWDVQFIPPTIVTGVPGDPCHNMQTVSRAFFQPKVSLTSTGGLDANRTQFRMGNQSYVGLLDVVKKHVHPGILGTDMDHRNFVTWWDLTTGKNAEGVMIKYRNLFVSDVLQKQFWPVLIKGEYNNLKAPTLGVSGLAIAALQTAMGQTDNSLVSWSWFGVRSAMKAAANEKTMALGLANSVMESSNDNFGILERLVVTNAAEKQAFAGARNLVQFHLHNGLEMVGPTHLVQHGINVYTQKYGKPQNATSVKISSPLDSNAFVYFQENSAKYKTSIDLLQNLVIAKLKTLSKAQVQTLWPVADAALKNLRDLAAEIEDWHGMVSSIRLDTAG